MDSSSSHRSPREEHPASPLRGHVAEAPPEDVPVKPPSPTIVVSRTSLEELVMVAKVEENRREPFSGGAGGGDQRSPAIVVNRASREELGMVAKVEESTRGEAFGGGDRRSPAIVVNRASREELGMVTKVEESSRGEVFGGGDRRSRVVTAVVRKTKREEMVRSAGLGIRVCAVVLCLISFSVMAADKTQGWSGDSFDRYKEYRYCMAMTVITFVYSGFQAYTQVHHFITGKHLIPRPIRYYFDFSMDQILAYLLMSASSSAATRSDIWQSDWGKDHFTEMVNASVGMSFLAFVALALSSLISGYNLCNRSS